MAGVDPAPRRFNHPLSIQTDNYSVPSDPTLIQPRRDPEYTSD